MRLPRGAGFIGPADLPRELLAIPGWRGLERARGQHDDLRAFARSGLTRRLTMVGVPS